MILFLIIVIIAIFFIVVIYYISYLTHLDMMSQYINGTVVIKRSFNDFKMAFNKKEWRRDYNFRKSFFDIKHMSHENYIHASIIIIDKVRYKFTFLSYIKFLIFIYLNRTTTENINRNVNNKKDIRRKKLKKIL